MIKNSGGHVCLVKDCKSKAWLGENIKFFRVPKEETRAKIWMLQCNRPDLCDMNPDALYKSYRMCSLHFDNRQYTNHLKNRLLPTAVPTIFMNSANSPTSTCTLSQTEDIVYESSTPTIVQSCTEIAGPSAALEYVSGDVHYMGHPTPLKAVDVDVVAISSSKDPKQLWQIGTQTPQLLSAQSPRKKVLRTEMAKLQTQLLQSIATEDCHSLQDFEKLCHIYLEEPLATLVISQARFRSKTGQARRYTSEIKQFALSVYFLGPRVYKFLSKTLYLPSVHCLQRYTEKIRFEIGLTDSMFHAMTLKVDTMSDQEKFCVLCMDEMSLKANLLYNINLDEIIGFHDTGSKTKTFTPAHNVAVVMAKGIYAKWKQPIAYFFVSSSTPAVEMNSILETAILKLEAISLKVCGIITDMCSNFLQLSKLWKITPEKPYHEIQGRKIFYLFDTPHLLTRNNLMKHSFCFDGKTTSWNHIKQFYESDKRKHLRLAPKLTDSHINPSNFEKMKVKLATQLLSATVAAGMETYISFNALTSAGHATVQFIERFDKLFDILNSSYTSKAKKYNRAYVGEQYQVEFLSDTLLHLKSLKIINEKGRDITQSIKSIKCWQVTIVSVMLLWEELQKHGFQFLLTRRLNQDPLENFFGSIRQQEGNAQNPTPVQFRRAFKKLFCTQLLNFGHANCTDDFDTILINLNKMPSQSKPLEIYAVEHNIHPFATDIIGDYRDESLPEQNALIYVCGYLLKKAQEKHVCNGCRTYEDTLQQQNIYTYFKVYETLDSSTFGNLHEIYT